MGGGEGRSSLGRQEGVPADAVRGKENEGEEDEEEGGG